MRNLSHPALDRYRDKSTRATAEFGGIGDHANGRFYLPPSGGQPGPGDSTHPVHFCVIAATGEGWEHVSVSTRDHCPTWNEMEYIKRLFFHSHECCMQLHVPTDEHINNNPNVLHIWRPIKQRIPRPPSWMV